jgi:hypothetical protein
MLILGFARWADKDATLSSAPFGRFSSSRSATPFIPLPNATPGAVQPLTTARNEPLRNQIGATVTARGWVGQ